MVVALADKGYRRDVLNTMLAIVSNEQALNLMNTSEVDFLEGCKASLTD